MSRLDIKTPDRAQMVVDQLYHDMERRIASSPPGLCPIDMARNFLNLCHAQTCGKCVPCRIGLGQLSTLMGKILEGKGKMEDLQVLEDTARTIECTSSCAIGYHAARLVLKGLEGFRDDYIEHIQNHRCLGNLENPVPCVALCPAGVDIPGYIALIHEGRCADAVRLIRSIFRQIAEYEGEIPGAKPQECGNWLEQNLPMAKFYAGRYLEQLTHSPRTEYPRTR